jgi:2,5-dihydroxypyridine 5,6-dioxygenase
MKRWQCTTSAIPTAPSCAPVAGNFLFSTGANEFAGRYTAGHFDLPMMGTTIELDGVVVVREGILQNVFG